MVFAHKCALTACADPGVFVKWVQARQPENRLGDVFWGVQILISIEPHITCDFPRGGGRWGGWGGGTA